MNYSLQQRIHIFSSADVTLFQGKSNERRVCSEVRFHGIKHYPLSNLTQRRSYCGKMSKYICSICDIGLDIDCFESFQENVNQHI